MKPLTIEELKALQVGDWVWITTSGNIGGFYGQIDEDSDCNMLCVMGESMPFVYRKYGKMWLAYKNKEFAESKDEWVELPCKKGDTMYWVYSYDQKEPISFIAESISGKILDDGEWRFFAFNRYGYGGACGFIDGRWYLGKDKSEAERRLAELKGEKV